MGEVIEGAVQHAPQAGRQSIRSMLALPRNLVMDSRTTELTLGAPAVGGADARSPSSPSTRPS
jgi:hypothetical protein